MADTAPSPAVIRRTQDLLGKYVKKPVLSDKLLRKPPFRFLHDVINVVIQDTGFLGGVYTADELVYDNVKEKDAKIEFLQKLIDAVKSSSTDGGTSIKARPSKIVAGHEPERTNELLQAIGRALDGAVDVPADAAIISNGHQATATAATASKDAARKKPSSVTSVDAVPSKISTKTSTKKPSTKTVSTTELAKKPTKSVRNAETKEAKGTIKAVKGSKSQASSNKKESNVVRPTKPNPIKEKQSSVEDKSVVDKVEVEDVAKPQSIVETLTKAGDADTDQSATFVSVLDSQANNNHSTTTSTLAAAFEPTIVNVQEIPKTDNGNVVAVADNQQPIIESTTAAPIRPAESNDLIDVIDQEAELRRRERSARKAQRSDRRKSSGHNSSSVHSNQQLQQQEDINEIAPPFVVDNNTVADEPTDQTQQRTGKSSKSHRKSGNLPTAAAVDHSDRMELSDTIIASDVVQPPPQTVRPRTSLRPPSVRPASARPGAPRRRERNVEVVLPPDEQQVISGHGNGNTAVSGGGAADAFGVDLMDDDENLIVIEDATSVTADEAMGQRMGDADGGGVADILMVGSEAGNNDDDAAATSAAQGHLVQQILQTQKQFAKNESEAGAGDKSGSDFATFHQRQSSAKQMDTLRDSIQQLTRSVNPLGKLIDFLQEDIDAMQMELQMWRGSYATAKTELGRERSEIESAVVPLQQQLEQIENTIREHIILTNLSRLSIVQNEEKLMRLLGEM